MSAGPQPTKYLSKDTNLETLLKEGHINQRMAAAVTFAFIEVYGLGETPKTIVLADLSRMSRRILLRQPNFGVRSVERIEKLCQMVGIQLLDQKTSLLKLSVEALLAIRLLTEFGRQDRQLFELCCQRPHRRSGSLFLPRPSLSPTPAVCSEVLRLSA